MYLCNMLECNNNTPKTTLVDIQVEEVQISIVLGATRQELPRNKHVLI